MSQDISIEGDLVTRVEGHGEVLVNATNGELEECEWQVVESPRFFESMVVGRSWDETHHIVSRICAICSATHTMTALKAIEDGLNIDVSRQDRKLRKLVLAGETIQSHVLHLGYLALPDLAGKKSVIPMADTHEEEVKTVIRLHELGNDMLRTFEGRASHGQRTIPGGFTQIPDESELKEIETALENSWDDVEAVVDLILSLAEQLPDFTRETEFISLTHPDEYALYDGVPYSSDTGELDLDNYEDIVNEHVVEQSTAKFTKHNRKSYMVGALARVNNNYDQLSPKAKEVAESFGLEPVCHQPFMNNVAQLVETAHLIENSLDLIDELLEAGLEEQSDYHKPDVDVTAGRGIGATEAPRGILFHDYTFDEDGIAERGNCVIPTNQNHANIQHDMEKMVPTMIDQPQDQIQHTLEMLVRAYDPCISCSTHYLDIEFVENENEGE
ncbi:coenzyme F420-reducing hydrogenase, alpha subunit [Halalkaliarchaeum desulfuricum]|uniref:Coenzyme F420-reducing hydrogenase, alpha subunit n=1 Tax=Halalkaliarchaeum desulfuricum TaxID=2055893 RepID=A0A343TLS1_9EURY|nr:Ni/Fe hydrogenase subunit alpha [Halalkaliarchaeum desulfuricum]AUX10043.1 coenzyme F420-reducing hydrogenase, alpha subunit [Halalkaliarchaeum desulfuricum]